MARVLPPAPTIFGPSSAAGVGNTIAQIILEARRMAQDERRAGEESRRKQSQSVVDLTTQLSDPKLTEEEQQAVLRPLLALPERTFAEKYGMGKTEFFESLPYASGASGDYQAQGAPQADVPLPEGEYGQAGPGIARGPAVNIPDELREREKVVRPGGTPETAMREEVLAQAKVLTKGAEVELKAKRRDFIVKGRLGTDRMMINTPDGGQRVATAKELSEIYDGTGKWMETLDNAEVLNPLREEARLMAEAYPDQYPTVQDALRYTHLMKYHYPKVMAKLAEEEVGARMAQMASLTKYYDYLSSGVGKATGAGEAALGAKRDKLTERLGETLGKYLHTYAGDTARIELVPGSQGDLLAFKSNYVELTEDGKPGRDAGQVLWTDWLMLFDPLDPEAQAAFERLGVAAPTAEEILTPGHADWTLTFIERARLDGATIAGIPYMKGQGDNAVEALHSREAILTDVNTSRTQTIGIRTEFARLETAAPPLGGPSGRVLTKAVPGGGEAGAVGFRTPEDAFISRTTNPEDIDLEIDGIDDDIDSLRGGGDVVD